MGLHKNTKTTAKYLCALRNKKKVGLYNEKKHVGRNYGVKNDYSNILLVSNITDIVCHKNFGEIPALVIM